MPKYSDRKQNDVEALARELISRFDSLTREFLAPQANAHFSRAEATLLGYLAEKGPATMSEISGILSLALSSTTGLIDRLVERRLVERTRPESDRRTVSVLLTTKGKRALETYLEARIGLGRGMLERLEPGEREALLALFRKMTGAP
jgi:DNA-binding MarR family transcriptional regulator